MSIEERLRDLGAALQNEHRLECALIVAEARLEKAKEALTTLIAAADALADYTSCGMANDAINGARAALAALGGQ